MGTHTKLKVTVLTVLVTFMFEAAAHALSGTYVVLFKGGGGLALFFNEKGTFTSIARSSPNKRKYYGKGKYTVSGDQLTLTTSKGTGAMTIEPNGNLYDPRSNFRFHRYHPRKQNKKSPA